MAGVMDKSYNTGRKKRIDLRYRLWKRSHEIEKQIKEHCKKRKDLCCLDIGTADGLMLSKLNRKLGFKNAYGIDLSEELLACNKDKCLKLSAMAAENLRFPDESMDIIIAAAVIEHTDDPKKMMSECHRVLRKGGIVVITTPNPIFDRIAVKIGYESKDEHIDEFDLKKLRDHLVKADLMPVVARHFMFFPFFHIPFEDKIESLINKVHLGFLMTNQIVVGKKI